MWGGEGVKPPKKARKVVEKILEKPRKDANIKNVIISESADKRIDKHLVSNIQLQHNSTHKNKIAACQYFVYALYIGERGSLAVHVLGAV